MTKEYEELAQSKNAQPFIVRLSLSVVDGVSAKELDIDKVVSRLKENLKSIKSNCTT